MSDSFWQKIEDIFPVVADLPTGEREEYLNHACDGDETLRGELLSLVKADKKAGEFYETPAVLPNSLSHAFSLAQTEISSSTSFIGRQIGAYRIVRKIGVGGMGTIYLANRADGAFQKEVAVKLVKSGSDTKLNLRRFRHERQVLAALEHPNIARLLDGGTTEEGLPYFVMEYVEGKQLFEFCDSKELDLPERLQLFRQICAAVSYAHDKQIVHRDLKPGNILVNEAGYIKLLDFGIAKILDYRLIQESAVQTAAFMRQMTPEYASPEQIKGEKITPASDVYSLGVILYELLTSERPYKFASRALHDIARAICEEEVRAPSVNIAGASPDDLKFIVLKALNKNPDERYHTANDLDRDIERFSTGLPVLTDETRLKLFEKVTNDSDGASVSLAVAPFQILTAENADAIETKNSNDFLAVGLADALTTRLSGVQRLTVRPTRSVLRLASEIGDAQALGIQLNADFVLTGHILHIGENIRVSVQLLKTRENSVLWAQSFDELERDVFQLQDSISERVAASLVPQITTEEQEILRRRGTSSAAAYEAYLRGRVSYHNYTFGGVANAEKYFKEAIAYDPNFALAYSGLAVFYNLQTIVGLVTNHKGFRLAKESARKAIELDPNLAEAYTALAFATCAYDWDFAEAERLFQKAIFLNPNYPRAYEWYAFLLSLTEKHDEAMEKMRRAEQLDLNSPAVATMFSLVLYNARRYEESLEKAHRSIELDPNYYIAQQSLGWICPRLGKFDEAIAGCRRAVEINDEQAMNKLSLALALIEAGHTAEARMIAAEIEDRRRRAEVPAYYSALIYTVLKEDKKAFYWLNRAVEERGYWTLRMRVEPRLDRLRSDPRFAEAVRKLKPLQGVKATDDFDLRMTGRVETGEQFKTRTIFAAVSALICVLIIAVAINFKNGFLGKKASLPESRSLNGDLSLSDTTFKDALANERGESKKPLTGDAVAESLYLAGKQQLATRSDKGIKKAIEFFTEAGKRDPNFALAFSGLADAHILSAHQHKNPAAGYLKAEEFAVKALALDPDLAEARISLGMARFRNTRDFSSAQKHFLRAIEIEPSLASAHHWYSIILQEVGKTDEAIREREIAARLAPNSAIIQFSLGHLYALTRRYDEALSYFDKAIENDNGFIAAHYWKSLVQQYRGEYDTALETHRKGRIYSGADENDSLWLLMQAQTHASHNRKGEALRFLNRYLQGADYRKHPRQFPHEVALIHNLLGDKEKAFEWIARVEIKKAEDAQFLIADPRFNNLHGDSRFAELAEKWRKLPINN